MFSTSITQAIILALLPLALAAPAGKSDTTSYVGASIPAAFSATSTPALFVVAEDFSSLHSNDPGEGTGQEEKRPYGIDGPNNVSFGFYESNGYTSETFRVSYYKTVTAAATATGFDAIVGPWVWKTGTPTSVIECIASATVSPTAIATITPAPDLTTTKDAFVMACSEV
ncbi:hypothetical protein IAR50_002628 [Cryptococcus sp. DSM 104548]